MGDKVKVKAWATKPDGYWALGRKFHFQQPEEIEVTEDELAELKKEYYIAVEEPRAGVLVVGGVNRHDDSKDEPRSGQLSGTATSGGTATGGDPPVKASSGFDVPPLDDTHEPRGKGSKR